MAAAPPKEIKVSELPEHYGIRRVQAGVFGVMFLTVCFQTALIAPCPLVLDSISQEFGVSDTAAALVTSGTMGASAIGAAVFGRVIDAVGRRKGVVIYTAAALFLSTLHLAIPHGPADSSFYALITLRVLVGIPYGGIIINQYQYISELLPDYARGSVSSATSLGWNLCHLYLVPFVPIYTDDAHWRSILGLLPIAPGILVLLACYFIPESPRWLLTGGHQEEARETLTTIFASQPIYGSASVGDAPRVDVSDISGRTAFGMTQEPFGKVLCTLLSPSLLYTTLLTSMLYAGLAGLANAMWVWAPLIVKRAAGMEPLHNVFMYGEAFGVCGTVITMFVIDRISRRVYLLTLFMLKAVLTAAFLLDAPPEGSSIPFFIWPVTVAVSSALWPALSIYISEAFPTGLRSTGTGVAFVMGRVASLVAPSAAGVVVRQSYKAVILPVAVLYAACGLLALMIPRETSSMPMQDVVEDDAKHGKAPIGAA